MKPADLAYGVGAEPCAQVAQQLREKERQFLSPGGVICIEYQHAVLDVHRPDMPGHAFSRHLGPRIQQRTFPGAPIQARLSQNRIENGPDGFGPAFLPVS